MIDFEQVLQAIPEKELKKIEEALLGGADAKQLQELFAAQGVELGEEDIAKVSSGIIAKIANDTDTSSPLSDEDLEAVAGGGLMWLGNGRECKG